MDRQLGMNSFDYDFAYGSITDVVTIIETFASKAIAVVAKALGSVHSFFIDAHASPFPSVPWTLEWSVSMHPSSLASFS